MFGYKFKKLYLFYAIVYLSSAILVGVLFAEPGLLKADELANLLGLSDSRLPVITDEELAQKKLFATGWECGKKDRFCAHILLNNSDRLLCVPAEVKGDSLMIPLAHFCLLAGGGLETGPEGKPLFIYSNRAYQIAADSPLLIGKDGSLTFPIAPYEAHGFLYVPLRFLCDALGIEINWRDESNVVLLYSRWVDAESLVAPMAALNETLLATIKEEEWPSRLEPVDVTVTFYFSKKNPPHTASGAIAAPGSIAADKDIPFGTQYYIPILDCIRDDCIFTVHDRGRAVKGDLIDVYVPNDFRGDPAVGALLRKGKFKTKAYLIHPEE